MRIEKRVAQNFIFPPTEFRLSPIDIQFHLFIILHKLCEGQMDAPVRN